MPTVTVSHKIPYACQFASPELVREFVSKEHDLRTDPCWAEYGAESPEEYAHWAMRSCGVVCVKMAVEGLAGIPPRPVMDWVRDGLAIGGYITELRHDRKVEVGWKHAALAELARAHGCRADLVSNLSPQDIANHIHADHLLIASVTYELGTDGPITRHNGHLIVVHGAIIDDTGRVESLIAHNPSGRSPATQVGAVIPAERFAQGFSGRGIVIGTGGQA